MMFVRIDMTVLLWVTVLIYLSGYVVDHNMPDQRQKKQRTLSALSSLFRARSRPPSPKNAVRAGMAMPSSSARAPISPEPLASSSSRFFPLIETVNESFNQRLDPNAANPQRWSPSSILDFVHWLRMGSNRPIAVISDIGQLNINNANITQNINNRK